LYCALNALFNAPCQVFFLLGLAATGGVPCSRGATDGVAGIVVAIF